MSDVNLIARKILFSDPDRASPRLSHKGKYISYLAPHEGVLNIWVARLEERDKAQPVTFDKKRGIQTYAWTWDEKHIVYVQDCDGNENWVVYALNIETSAVRALTPDTGVFAMINAMSEKFPKEFLVYLNERRPDFHDVYRINIETGERTLFLQNDGFATIVVDDNFDLRFASKMLPDGGVCVYERQDREWVDFMTIGADDINTTSLGEFNKAGQKLFMIDSRGHDTAGLYQYDLQTHIQTLIWRDPRADIGELMLHPITRELQAVGVTYDRKQWIFFDQAVQDDITYLKTIDDADIEIVSRTHDDHLWLVVFVRDDAPLQYYLFDRSSRHAQYLFCNRTDLKGIALAKMHASLIKTRDDLTLVSYLTVPLAVDPERTGIPHKPIPLVLNVHGGPHARDHWGLNPVHQWLSNRGYAVLSVNYRGSTGFGKNFIKAGNGEWSGKMHDDLLDAVQWAVQQGIADPQRICIMGGSYGGYAVLVGLTKTPDVFACGVDVVGPSNLLTLCQSIPDYWKPYVEQLRRMVGADHETVEGQAILAEKSPITYAHQINKPLLIGHGANDPRVKLAESDQIVAQLKAKNIPVTYVVYPDEGHGFQRPQNRRSFNAVTELFLQQVLGGHAELIGDDFDNSTLDIREGLEHVTGVSLMTKKS